MNQRRYFLDNAVFINLIKCWLIGILLLLPFQYTLVNNTDLFKSLIGRAIASLINRSDELTVVLVLPLAIIRLYKDKEIFNRLYLILFCSILAFTISGLVSGIVNGNSLFITIIGTFDYIKYFLVIFIYAAFFKDTGDIKRVFRFLLVVAVCLAVVAIIQEIWALVFRYILKKDITDSGMYIFYKLSPITVAHYEIGNVLWRLGLYRTTSLMVHYNIFGLYSLLILTLYLYMQRRVNFAVIGLLFTGIFFTISRIVYSGFVFMAGLQIFRGRRWLIVLLIPIITSLSFISFFPDFDISKSSNKDVIRKEETSILLERRSYRGFALEKSVEVWKDHPIFGVGPGMFGSAVAKKYKSPVHKKYFFPEWLLSKFGGLDQFWPQLLAEVGTIGILTFVGLFFSLFVMFFISRKQAGSEEIKGMFTGLAVFTIAILLYISGGPLDVVSILFPYFALTGMGLGFISSRTGTR